MAERVKVLNISRGFDTGGTGWRMFDAFGRLAPDWEFRSMYRPNGFEYIAYPTDLAWDGEIGKRLYDAADVIHLHNGFGVADMFERHGKRRPALTHYHGSAFRGNPRAFLNKQRQRNAIGLVSTLDLFLVSPDELEWLPSPYNLDWLASLP